MVAVVTGNGLGLERSSAFVLGSRGQVGSAGLGRANDGVYVNAATGNLVVANRDEFLIGRGLDSAINRTYNSLGTFTDDNGDNWASIGSRVVDLVGTLNTAGSYLDRIGWDGDRTRYYYDTSKSAYVSWEGAGAYDAVTYNGSNWKWQDGDTGVVETYDATIANRVMSKTDRDGNTITYTYTGDKITTITTADGNYTNLTWSGNNLTSLATTYFDTQTSTNKTLTRTRYTYDGSNRLSTVTVDLSPEDNSIADSRTYVTTYTYDGSSKRIASIAQTDGSLLSFTYDGSGRVVTFVQAVETGVTRTTTFAYGSGNTTVTDAQGNVTTLYYDGSGQLTRIAEPAPVAGGNQKITDFSYTANGDLYYTSEYDGASNYSAGTYVTRDWYRYDANGNPLDIYRWNGDYVVTRWTYGSKNEVLTETSFATADPDGHGGTDPTGAMTTRFVYDSENHLRFKVTAEGRVTEYRYDAPGNLTSEIDYAANAYTSGTISETEVANWVTAISDKSTSTRTDTTYDFRGNVSTVTAYAKTDTSGNGLTSTGNDYSRITYVYDQAGNLLSKLVNDGSAAETYAYDGLGRTIRFTDAKGIGTWTSYIDAQARTVTTLANGLIKTAVYNKAGELIGSSETNASVVQENTGLPLPQWSTGDLTVADNGTVDGAAAKKYTNNTSLTRAVSSNVLTVAAGETITYSGSFQATAGSPTFATFGIYGYTSGWGAANIASARILSGPGYLVQATGGA